MSANALLELGLECGHGWPGESTREQAEEFLALCLATGDSVWCSSCGRQRVITGPVRPSALLSDDEIETPMFLAICAGIEAARAAGVGELGDRDVQDGFYAAAIEDTISARVAVVRPTRDALEAVVERAMHPDAWSRGTPRTILDALIAAGVAVSDSQETPA